MSINNTTDIFEESHDVEEEMVELTAEEVLKQLEVAWCNETNAPELLQPKTEMVECMLEQVSDMENNLQTLSKGDLRIFVHKMEISRIKFVINSYLRTRLDKIQNNYLHYFQARDSDNPSRLSRQEEDFLDAYKRAVDGLHDNLCLGHLQGGNTELNSKYPRPNLHTAVFMKATENIQGLEITDHGDAGRDEIEDLNAGDQYLLQYSNISHLIDSSQINLI